MQLFSARCVRFLSVLLIPFLTLSLVLPAQPLQAGDAETAVFQLPPGVLNAHYQESIPGNVFTRSDEGEREVTPPTEVTIDINQTVHYPSLETSFSVVPGVVGDHTPLTAGNPAASDEFTVGSAAYGNESGEGIPATLLSYNTRLLAVTREDITSIQELGDEAVIGISSSWAYEIECLKTALNVYGIHCDPVDISGMDHNQMLLNGSVDAVLVDSHPSKSLLDLIEFRVVRLLLWNEAAVAAVENAYPDQAEKSYLTAYTYWYQSETLLGYHPVGMFFPDEHLELAIRDVIAKPEGAIYPADLVDLGCLDLSNKKIADLTGLEYCDNLTRLYLSENNVTDLSPLVGLTGLEILDLSGNYISEYDLIEVLPNKTCLRDLSVDECHIRDVGSILESLPYPEALTSLSLSDNLIEDISPLSSMPNLFCLDLSYNLIGDISPLNGLTGLEILDLDHNDISEHQLNEVLSNKTRLSHLGVEYCGISDPGSIIESLPSQALTSLSLASNQITDISPLGELYNLERLDLSDNLIEDITPLDELCNLERLDLSSNRITDISPLGGLLNLLWFDLSYNRITDISPIGGLFNLLWFDLSYNRISDISSLSGLYNLESLDLHLNQISDISPLTGLYNLESLDLHLNQISDISPLNGITDLEILDLSNNDIPADDLIEVLFNKTWLSGLAADSCGIRDVDSIVESLPCPEALTSLSLDSNQISDISALSGMTNLYCLHLSHNQISDISPLSGLHNLYELDLYNNQIETVALSDLTSLEELKLNKNPINTVSLNNLSSLEGLDLSDYQISTVSLNNLTNLEFLYLDNNQIDHFSSLSGLYELAYLYLSNNRINDISPLSGLYGLNQLYLDNNRISDISFLIGLNNLYHLNLSDNLISDISALDEMYMVDFIDLSGNQINDIPALSGTYLHHLDLSGNQISNISALSGTYIYELDLSHNQISDISALGELYWLESLDLSDNLISDISSISFSVDLLELHLDHNRISDISSLSGLTDLRYLYLSGNRISDISYLSGLTDLRYIYLSSNRISDISALSGLTKLKYLYLSDNRINDISALIENTRISSGDDLDLAYNLLDLTAGSPDMLDIQTLIDRGVNVSYLPQNSMVILTFVLQGGARPDSGWTVPVTAAFYTPGADVLTALPLYSFESTSTQNGEVALAPAGGVLAGTYDITLSSPHCLTNVKRAVAVDCPDTTVNMGTLLEGNANDDFKINISDFGILAAAYGKQRGQAGFDERADFNRDDVVNISDFGLLAANYAVLAPVEVE